VRSPGCVPAPDSLGQYGLVDLGAIADGATELSSLPIIAARRVEDGSRSISEHCPSPREPALTDASTRTSATFLTGRKFPRGKDCGPRRRCSRGPFLIRSVGPYAAEPAFRLPRRHLLLCVLYRTAALFLAGAAAFFGAGHGPWTP